MACATYLSSNIFIEGACTSSDFLKARHRSQPFMNYAVHQLSSHLNSCDENLLTDIVFRFVGSLGNISLYLQTLHLLAKSWRVLGYDNYLKGWHPLHVAAALGHRTAIEKLLDCGAAISVLDSQRQTTLHIAASEGQEIVVRLLIDKGADISLLNYHGKTALHLAASKGHKAVSQLLLQRGADLSARDSLGYTPLHNAAFEKHMDTIKLLIDSGANLSS